MDVLDWFQILDKFEVYIYRRPDFLADDFEYEQYVGQRVLRNIFKYQKECLDENIVLSFPERWINCVECHQLFPRIQVYYPNLKSLIVKTHAPLIITNVPANFAFYLNEENDIVESSGGWGNIGESTSVEDPQAIFHGISKGKLFIEPMTKS